MTISMYSASVPVFTRMLTNLLAMLEKAEAYAAERKFKPDLLVTARLAPDMLPLSFQIQSATDNSKFAVARLSGQTAPSWPDEEKTMEELKARVRKALDYLATFKPADIDGSAARPVTLKSRAGETTHAGADYLLARAMPNFYFHVTTAYAILRHNGVPLGKSDFVG